MTAAARTIQILLLTAGASLAPSVVQAQVQANPHGALPASIDCAACHTPDQWTPVRQTLAFDHDETAFPLVGNHVDAQCGSCHLDLNFSLPQVEAGDCTTCHLDVHQAALSNDCTSCHNTVSFLDLPGVELHTRTQFPLTGAHLQVTCESCHIDDSRGAFSPLDVDCVGCHEVEYERTVLVDHETLQFPVNCEQCHGTLDWSAPTGFDHGLLASGFMLLGAHNRIGCGTCHILPSFDLLFGTTDSQDCVGCHQEDFDTEHGGSGFPSECVNCHNDDTWEGATFDHLAVSEGFPLIGRHAQADCSTCHLPPDNSLVFNTTNAEDCVACHQVDYDGEHSGSGYPTECLACHDQEMWAGAVFNHDGLWFPIFSGKHVPETWNNDCTSCHPNPSDSKVFSCVNCHQHPKLEMDDKHSEVPDYAYESQSCLTCHPTGN